MRDHEPDVFAAIRTMLLPKDYVLLRMTGNKASDMSDNSGALWLDVPSRHWNDWTVAGCGLGAGQMPELSEGTDVIGHLRASVAQEWGMPAVLVAAGGGDNAAAVASRVSASCAMATRCYRSAHRVSFSSRSRRSGRTLTTLSTRSATACPTCGVRWASIYRQHPASTGSLAQPGQAACPKYSGAPRSLDRRQDPKFTFPTGARRTKIPTSTKRFWAFDNTDDGRLAQAALEGVAFSLADGLNALDKAGTRISTLSVVGAGARSAYWGRIIAAALKIPLTYSDGDEVNPALGAARLARLAMDGGDPKIVYAPPATARVIEPCDTLIDQASFPSRPFADRSYSQKGSG